MAEVTALTPQEEFAFRLWAKDNGIQDVDSSDAYYDYRGYWRSSGGAPHKQGEHFPDTYKQHGHPTFSQESQYSTGHPDGGIWVGDTFIPQPRMVPSHKDK